MSIFDSINAIELPEILRACGIHFDVSWNTLCLYEGDTATDGWRADVANGNVTDFSGKRAYGDRITFVMRHLGMEKGATVNWYKSQFWLVDDKKFSGEGEFRGNESAHKTINNPPKTMEASNKVKIDVQAKWDSYGPLNAEQIAYLKTRAIDYSLVKDYVKNHGGYVSCAIYNVEEGIISIQNRSITEKKFVIEKGTNSRGVFITKIDKSVKKVYVVEGMFDFLSMAQFVPNVIGLKSAKDGAEVVKAMFRAGYEIVVIPDNDEAGKTVLETLSDIKFSLFDISGYGVKDINEFFVESGYGKDLIDIVEDERTRIPKNIDEAFSKLRGIQDSYKKNGWRLGEDGPFPELDKYTQGLINGKVYTIGGFSNTGKSQFSYEYAQYFLEKKKKVAYFSIEVDTGLLLAYIAKAFYKKSFWNILDGSLKIDRDVFENLYLYDNINSLEKLVETVDIEKPDVVFIDFVQGFECVGTSEYEKMTKIASEIQKMAIRNNIKVFSLSQVNNSSRDKDGGSVTLKGSGALFHSSDVIFILHEEAGLVKLTIAKNKFGKKMKEFEINIDFDTGKILIFEDIPTTQVARAWRPI